MWSATVAVRQSPRCEGLATPLHSLSYQLIVSRRLYRCQSAHRRYSATVRLMSPFYTTARRDRSRPTPRPTPVTMAFDRIHDPVAGRQISGVFGDQLSCLLFRGVHTLPLPPPEPPGAFPGDKARMTNLSFRTFQLCSDASDLF